MRVGREAEVRTFRLTLAYDGRRFRGWQRQRKDPTVQRALEEAVGRLAGRPVAVAGAGRTDSGVHALRQVAHVRLRTTLEPWRLRDALNAHLPRDIVVSACEPAPAEFHARFDARGKRYAYGIRLAGVRSPFLDAHLWRLSGTLDLGAMRRGASCLLGRHDFSAFRGSLGRDHDPVRTLRSIHIRRHGERLWLVFEGDGFLYRMVRSIVGTLVEVGRGRLEPAEVARILGSRDRRRAGRSAPAYGLVLLRCLYERIPSPRTARLDTPRSTGIVSP